MVGISAAPIKKYLIVIVYCANYVMCNENWEQSLFLFSLVVPQIAKWKLCRKLPTKKEWLKSAKPSIYILSSYEQQHFIKHSEYMSPRGPFIIYRIYQLPSPLKFPFLNMLTSRMILYIRDIQTGLFTKENKKMYRSVIYLDHTSPKDWLGFDTLEVWNKNAWFYLSMS